MDVTQKPVSQLYSKDYWLSIVPGFHVNDSNYQKGVKDKEFNLSKEKIKELKKRMNEDGYFTLDDLPWIVQMDKLAQAITTLMKNGWTPTFINMFDEAWAMVQQLTKLMGLVTNNKPNMDLLSWHIDPNFDQSGFSPHRDRQPDDSPSSFHSDGQPKYSTCWVAVTEACPDNSCLYVIPRHSDPGYFVGDDPSSDPMKVALPSKESYQNIRALPCKPGSAVLFSHRIIHWGSKGRKGYKHPRIAFSFAFSSDDFEPSYFSNSHLPFPSIELRLALTSAQMIAYYDRFMFNPKQLKYFYSIFKSELNSFHPTYQEKIIREYVNAVKEGHEELKNIPENKKENENHNDEDEEDILDDALDQILKAKLNGVDFEDDFDDIEDLTTQINRKKTSNKKRKASNFKSRNFKKLKKLT